MDFTTVLVISVSIVVIGIYLLSRAADKDEKRLIAALNGVIDQLTPDFHNANASHVGSDERSCILLSEETKRLCLIDLSDDYKTQHRVINHRDLLEVEIVQDGYSVNKVSRSSQAANALIGGVLFGGAGAAVGALTSTSSTRGKINRIDLKLIVNDLANPLFSLNFLRTEADKGSSVYKDAMKNASEWMARIKVLIHLADKEDASLKT